MADPFLLEHLIRPLFFDIGGVLSPVSIRDQMIRGRMAVDRAIDEGLLGLGRPLLAIGAGAGGATAAIRAAQRGIETWLVDAAPAAFMRQAACTSRFVDPTQYDWPLLHWREGTYPWEPPLMPLSWQRDYASQLAFHWQRTLATAQTLYAPRLRVEYQISVSVESQPLEGLLPVTLSAPALGETAIGFGMVLSCVGFGTERVVMGDYASTRFWDSDFLGHQDLGLPRVALPRVLVSGGGDGALQDCLRILTRGSEIRSAGELYAAVTAQLRFQEEIEALERRLQCAEDQAQRALVWSARPEHDHPIHEQLHRIHAEVIASLSDRLWSFICSALEGLIVSTQLELLYSCDHFTASYALNRFLVLLMARYLRENHGQELLRPGLVVAAVAPGGTAPRHRCTRSAADCYRHPHRVTVTGSACPNGTPATRNALDHAEHDIILLRHGVTPPTLVLAGSNEPAPRRRQLLPYHVPG